MSKKTIDTSKITNDLQGASSFFGKSDKNATRKDAKKVSRSQSPKSSPAITPPMPESSVIYEAPAAASSENKQDAGEATQDSERDGAELASLHASMLASIRGVVRKIGKESVYVRVTPEEKVRLSDIVYTLKREGVRTTENEVSRIALNYLIEDYKLNGERSMLAQVIEALQA